MFLVDRWPISEPKEITQLRKAYDEYLSIIKPRIPPSAFEFASAPWHYDPSDHRCPHDAWLEYLRISETSEGKRMEVRSIDMELRLLGAYHDGYLSLGYKDVQSYSLSQPLKVPRRPSHTAKVGHEDLLVDEFGVSPRGMLVHELLFSFGARWSIECRDFQWLWSPTRATD